MIFSKKSQKIGFHGVSNRKWPHGFGPPCSILFVMVQLVSHLQRDHDLGRKFLDVVSKREGVEKLGGMSETSAEGTTHSVLTEEQVAFANWINRSINAHGVGSLC